ncbi:radical SAM protein [bacterium]|nr:radical SAM protein [candidate division CSSED10-310 bacterium]
MTNNYDVQPSGIYIKIHGMPCVNRCRHCYYHGGDHYRMMPVERIRLVLERAAELKDSYPMVMVHYFDEPTLHPDFLSLMEYQAELGLLPEGYFLPTNGFGPARMNDAQWERLKAAGVSELQLTFYGIGAGHDAFAGRHGAYDDLVKTLVQARRHGLSCYSGIVLHCGNATDIAGIRQTIMDLAGNGLRVGWFICGWLGRGADDAIRPRQADLANRSGPAGHFMAESEHRRLILEDDALGGQPAVPGICDFLSLEVQPDLTVYYGGGCDHAPPPELLPFLRLGSLAEEGFAAMAARAAATPPEPFRLLGNITWRVLAERYGDPDNDRVYWQQDLVTNKWGNLFLREHLGLDR